VASRDCPALRTESSRSLCQCARSPRWIERNVLIPSLAAAARNSVSDVTNARPIPAARASRRIKRSSMALAKVGRHDEQKSLCAVRPVARRGVDSGQHAGQGIA
jgi:hypothetical protein